MRYLVIVSCIWAFSFPLIKHYLSGIVDNYFAILVRFVLAFIVFLPLMRFHTNLRLALKLMGIGALQIGVMYIFYYNAFLYISASEVALFTIFTPFYVTLIYDICHRRLRSLYFISVAMAVFGAYIIRSGTIDSGFVIGFLLVQVANICFGAGQSLYKYTIEQEKVSNQAEVFGFFYLGAIIVGVLSFVTLGDVDKIPSFSLNSPQWIVLIYLGVIASGAGYFMWNKGVSMSDSGVVAIMNNAMIPLVVLVDWLFWGRQMQSESLIKLICGGVVIFVSLAVHYWIMRWYNRTNLRRI